MARTPVSLADNPSAIDAINLRRVLLRLEQQILLGGPGSALLTSSFERDKVAQNLEYARTLLLRIQHNSSTIKSQAKKQAQQGELARHRTLIKHLTEKLYDLRRQEDDAADAEVDVSNGVDDGAEEDLLARYFAPEPAVQTKASHSRGSLLTNGVSTTETQTASDGVRARNVKAGDHAATSTSGTSLPTKGPSTALPGDLFGTGTGINSTGKVSGFRSNGKAPEELSTEQRLVQQDATQAELTSSLVTLARQLKQNSQQFADDLAADSEALTRTEGALGRNQEGLDTASRRMGVLRKMTEGRWWWQRYIMFILLAVLWVAQLFLVFVGPKIRL